MKLISFATFQKLLPAFDYTPATRETVSFNEIIDILSYCNVYKYQIYLKRNYKKYMVYSLG